MSLARLWEFMWWLAPYVLTVYVGVMLLVIARLVWLGYHERTVGEGAYEIRRSDRY